MSAVELLHPVLQLALENEASDIHIKPNSPPYLRIHGSLLPVEDCSLTNDQINTIADDLLPQHLKERFMKEFEADFSYVAPGIGRYRVNMFLQRGSKNLVMRHVVETIPTFEQLALSPIVAKIALSERGIVLAAGSTGSGKSTTLAAMLQHINANRKRRVITIEDPIEYLFIDQKSVISQREVGLDTLSFNSALTRVLRQDPDVIMIGEMRDAESFMAALNAADTGHLVLSTLHTTTAAQSISRILDFFPQEERTQVRMQLAACLRAVICQRLVPSADGKRVFPALEIMIGTPTVRKLLEENLIEKLPAAIETGIEDGMQTFNQALLKMIQEGKITEEEGLAKASNPEALRMNLKGIFLDEARRILG
jgi:twitching motility protein PilT